MDIPILYVPAVFAKVGGDAMSACFFSSQGSLDRAGLACIFSTIACLSDSGYVIDINAKLKLHYWPFLS